MTAFEKLAEIKVHTELDSKELKKIIIEFKNAYLKKTEYRERLARHRKPAEFIEEILQQSYRDLNQIGERAEMRDIEVKNGISSYGYVYKRVNDIWEADNSLNLDEAIKEYCRQSGKDFNTTAVHLAEYWALEKVGRKLRSDQRRHRPAKKAEQTYAFQLEGLSEIRNYILDYNRSDVVATLFTLRDKMQKPIFPNNLIRTGLKAHYLSYPIDEVFKTLREVQPRTIRANLSSFLNLSSIGLPTIQHVVEYQKYLNLLTKELTNGLPVKEIQENGDETLLELNYQFLPELDEPEEEKKEQRIILLNQTQHIQQVIMDIYRNNAKLLQLKPRQFEEMIAELLSNQGFQVELTKQTRDGGFDIVAIRDIANHSPLRWLVECKKWNGRVGVEVIRSFKEVVQSQNANRGIIATTGYFSSEAIKKRKETPYLLDFRDKDAVMQWVADYANQKM